MAISLFPPPLRFLFAISSGLTLASCAGPRGGQVGDRRALEDQHLEQVVILDPPVAGSSVRVGGDFDAKLTGSDGDFRAGPCRVDTPLPSGYPMPTPPDAIELKTYPEVRIAEVTGVGDPDDGMNDAFWPLFKHIKGHGIEMTSPVEMNYRGLETSNSPLPQSWSMSFLYRQPELNSTGIEGQVTVRDSAPVTVIAVGLRGSYSMSLVQQGMQQIERWLQQSAEWEPAGNWRALYYNGPSLFWWNKWAEVQIPVRRSALAQPLDMHDNKSAEGAMP